MAGQQLSGARSKMGSNANAGGALFRGSLEQWARLGSGLVLFIFVFTHLANHAVGIFGIHPMDVGQTWRFYVTQTLAGKTLLYGAAAVHVSLGLARLARRQRLTMPVWEATQIISGLAIPFILADHVIATRLAGEWFQYRGWYEEVLVGIWASAPFWQALIVVVVWTHGCIGLHYWLRLSPTYRAVQPVAFAGAVALPLASLAGFVAAAREETARFPTSEALDKLAARTRAPDTGEQAVLEQAEQWILLAYGGLILLAVGLVVMRFALARMRPRVSISYAGGSALKAAPGPTLLEMARSAGVPHTSVCGGRARCSTCRVQVLRGAETLAAAAGAEANTLRSIGAGENVRLACQIRPTRDLVVQPLVPVRAVATGDANNATGGQGLEAASGGIERTMAVLFLDVRGFTTLSADRLPYDVVYLLNETFAAAGGAVVAHGGWIDKYLGDGLMAVFGRNVGAKTAARQALAAARAVDLALETANEKLAHELASPLRIGIGLHLGPLVMGQIGHADSAALTVIGRTVNTAARLEAMTKDLGCQVVVSDALIDGSGLTLDGVGERHSVSVRGLEGELAVLAIAAGRDLPDQLTKDVKAPHQAAASA